MEVKHNVNLAPLTTLNVGGRARYFSEIKDVPDLLEALSYAEKENIPVFPIGDGSNLLVGDDGIDGLVLKILIPGLIYDGNEDSETVTVGAGMAWDDLVVSTVEHGYSGLENLSGIPGLVGAAPIQNINAYGTTVGDYISKVVAVDKRTKQKRFFDQKNCQFAYRSSFFKTGEGENFIITNVVFSLTKNKISKADYKSASQSIKKELERQGIVDPTAKDIREAVLKIRRNIGMLRGQYQSAGSFFKNIILEPEKFVALQKIVDNKHQEKSLKLSPWHWRNEDGSEKVSAAFLIECTPYNKTDFSNKSFNKTVSISPLHSLSIINKGGAKARDVKEFADLITKTIQKNFNVAIEPEVCYL